jgi:type II secretory pathway pseudopilin PulG
MKRFTKSEIISLVIIFSVLIAVSIPNFIISLRRARDQVRRDDMGVMVYAFGQYQSDNETFPKSSPDGRIINCLSPGDKPVKNKLGNWVLNLIPCEWGVDAFSDLITGRVYRAILPRDPDYQKGAKYLYFSDGERYQIYAAMEGADEAEVDPKIIARNLMCGSRVCNIGRFYNVPIDISIEEYNNILIEQNAQNKK